MRSQPKNLGHLELEEAWLGGARAGPMDLSRITQKLEVLDEYKMKDSTMRCVKYLLFMLNLIISVSILYLVSKRISTREAKGASKTRDSRSVSKLRHTRPRQYGLGCGRAPDAVTWIPVSVSVDAPRHVTGAS